MKDLGKLVLEYVLEQTYGCATFTDGSLLKDSYEYRLEAQTKINAMNNCDLLELVSNALAWEESGGDIGL